MPSRSPPDDKSQAARKAGSLPQTPGVYLMKDAAGRVSRWADKSDRGNDAAQSEIAAQPQYVPDGIGGRPVVRFGGSAYLNLGQPACLDFRPGQPFTFGGSMRPWPRLSAMYDRPSAPVESMPRPRYRPTIISTGLFTRVQRARSE